MPLVLKMKTDLEEDEAWSALAMDYGWNSVISTGPGKSIFNV